MKRPKPKNGLEEDVLFYKDMYCYTQNNPKLVKWVKRKYRKRERRLEKEEIRRHNGTILY